ncbi:alpha/beta fold hydrolase [Dongia rigui]|uniref:Alpha/beta fold hydrolase n=1 Tax=Dongia rigui TaxID=940149 RepID=A0ABU5E3S7_9PROT|nr:alpha/beta fold hydrolase [Dongia rigui]MDY0874226.1 alpha/beta fold hydrolase [Dongia rigui]
MSDVENRVGKVVFADCEVDLAAFELRRNGTLCPVEPQVFDLIAYLIRHPDRLISKDELIAGVWHGRIVSDAALASRIKSARRALGDDGEQQRLIRTVHGRGIRFVGDIQRAAESAQGDAVPSQKIQFCTAADGVRIAYARVGSGPVLVKPAHWLTHLDYDWESPVWHDWLSDLARHYTLIRYDQRGNGLSDREVENVSLDAMVGDLLAVLDANGLDRVPLFGHSQGCAVAATFAARYPERVSRMVFLGGYARGWAKRGDPELVTRRRAISTLIAHGWGQDNPAFRQLFTSFMMPGASPEHMQWYNELQRRTASPEGARRLHDAFGEIDVTSNLARVKAPTLVMHARGDASVPFEEGRILATGIPGARFVPLEGNNHVLMKWEPAWQRFMTETQAFLNT